MKQTYLISYDLINQKSYQAIYDYMSGYNDKNKPLETVYLVHTSKSAAQIRDDLKKITDSDDKVLVIKINTSIWASFNLAKTAQWLNQH